MDTYAPTTRNLSCNITTTKTAGGYAPLAPGTVASLEQRSRAFGRMMGASFTHALSGWPYRIDLGYGKHHKKASSIQRPITPREKRSKNVPLYCVDCSEIRQMNGIEHGLYRCRALSRHYGRHIANDVHHLNDSLASAISHRTQDSSYRNILIASQDMQGITTFCPSYAEFTIEFPYLFANQGGDNPWADSVSYSGCMSTLPQGGKVIICLPSEDLFDRFGEFTCVRPSAFQMNFYIRKIQKMIMILRGYNVEHLLLVGPMLRLPRKIERFNECYLLFREVNKFLKNNLYGCDFLNPMEIFFPADDWKAPIGSMCGIFSAAPVYNTHFTWATKCVLMQHIGRVEIKAAPWDTLSILKGESYWKWDSRADEKLRLPWEPVEKAKDNMVPYPDLPPVMQSNKKTSLELSEVEELVLTISEEEESELLDSAIEDSSPEETSEQSNSNEGRTIVNNIDSPVKVWDWTPPEYAPQKRNCKVPCLHPIADGCGKITIKDRLGPPVNISEVTKTSIQKPKRTRGKTVPVHKGGQSFWIGAEASTNECMANHPTQTVPSKKKKKKKSKNKQPNGPGLVNYQNYQNWDFAEDYW